MGKALEEIVSCARVVENVGAAQERAKYWLSWLAARWRPRPEEVLDAIKQDDRGLWVRPPIFLAVGRQFRVVIRVNLRGNEDVPRNLERVPGWIAAAAESDARRKNRNRIPSTDPRLDFQSRPLPRVGARLAEDEGAPVFADPPDEVGRLLTRHLQDSVVADEGLRSL